MLFYNNIHSSKLIIENKLRNQIAHGGNVSHPSGAPATPHHPSCVQGVLLFPLHPARYEPVSTYLGPHSRRTHVPLVRHPPSLDIKANRNALAIRRHRMAWEHQAKWQYTRSDARTWPTLFQRCDSVDDNGPTLRQHCVLAICEMLFVQPITQLYSVYNWIIQSNIATSDYKLNN